MVLFILLLILIAAALYVRLAPHDAARWHQPVEGDDKDFPFGLRRIIPGGSERFSRLDAIIRATPRTQHLAGSLEEGRLTYVTRSALWGFPDYTTIDLRDQEIAIYARLRFGKADMGVNRRRVLAWLERLDS
ncbi:Protein of unknown function [Poseidonocella pacifica]|uniref:DUF1499 domain-containing protein n=1 Tax=Poseidonocella pacifica TaxID=871651 RepID=A0A1I0VAG2_9RHOB|nr:DUF1499 domain-containing protein [Poseidonocella pacifica]SFA73222.1 Protein of unknown function [Poseidonocella pacifica]